METKNSKAGAIPANALLLSALGGTIEMVRDGEVLAAISIPPGRVPIADYMPLLPDGAWYETNDLAVIQPRSLISSQTFGDVAMQSGANPDFKPTTASRFEAETRQMIAGMLAQQRGLAAKVRAYESIERIPQNPAPA
ncbi:hypothetical protein, partial [Cypionkella sp.]|uniref:hypothetical protein n=1 Tax=Cypionkella sp. TaxID=2811411 RepID=UPI002ABAAE96